MRWVKFIALVIFSIAPATAGEFSENPAFCFGFWDMEQEITDRLVTACKIGCNVGQDYCL